MPGRFNVETVDLVSMSADGSACLYIVQDAPWSGSDEQLMSLQQKIHNYVGFALDGEMASRYPKTESAPWRIVIDSKVGALDPRTSQLINQVAVGVRRYSGNLVVET